MKQVQGKAATTTAKASKAGKFVDTAHVETLRENYRTERWLDNSRKLGKEDALSIWYSVEELEQFLETAKAEGGDGVRMYFGAYSKNHAPNPLYAGRQTVVLVATKLKEADGMIVHKDLYVNTEKGSNIVAYNIGRMCPPFCVETERIFETMELKAVDKAVTI